MSLIQYLNLLWVSNIFNMLICLLTDRPEKVWNPHLTFKLVYSLLQIIFIIIYLRWKKAKSFPFLKYICPNFVNRHTCRCRSFSKSSILRYFNDIYFVFIPPIFKYLTFNVYMDAQNIILAYRNIHDYYMK